MEQRNQFGVEFIRAIIAQEPKFSIDPDGGCYPPVKTIPVPQLGGIDDLKVDLRKFSHHISDLVQDPGTILTAIPDNDLNSDGF